MDTRIHYALLALFYALLWWIVGVISGSVVAFFVYYFSPESSGRDWPAIISFAAISLGCGIFGIFRSWKLYSRKVADMAS